MADDAPRADMATQGVVYRVAGTDRVAVERDIEFHRDHDSALRLDLYQPLTRTRENPSPAVVFVSGYPDPGMELMTGRKFKDLEYYMSWARLVAASGRVAVTYSNREPVADLERLLEFLRSEGSVLGVDAARIALWACSGNVPNALGALIKRRGEVIDRALLAYGYMLDRDGANEVAAAARQFRFANPAAGRSVADVPAAIEIMVVRAGADAMPGLNASIDRFVTDAVAIDRPITLINHAAAPHAFDLVDDRLATHRVMGAMLEFLTSPRS